MVDSNGDVSSADGIPLVEDGVASRFSNSGAGGRWAFKALRGNRVLSMSACFFVDSGEMAERARQKLNTEGGSALAFHEEPR